MSTFGIIIIAFWIASSLLLVVLAKRVRKLLQHELFWKIISLVVFSYVFYFRYYYDLQDYMVNGKYESTVFLTDFCVWAGVFAPVLTFFRRTRTFFSPLAFWFLIASGVTAYEIAFVQPNNGNFWEWVLVGGQFNGTSFARLHVSMHYLTFVIGLLLLINTNWTELKWTYLLKNNAFMALYLTYAFCVGKVLGMEANVTGLVESDWMGGQYKMATQVLGLVWPEVLFVGFGILWATDVGLVLGLLIFKRVVVQQQSRKTTGA